MNVSADDAVAAKEDDKAYDADVGIKVDKFRLKDVLSLLVKVRLGLEKVAFVSDVENPPPFISIITSLKSPTDATTPVPIKLILLTCVVNNVPWFSILTGIKPGRDILL
jgi:hypothetical protein